MQYEGWDRPEMIKELKKSFQEHLQNGYCPELMKRKEVANCGAPDPGKAIRLKTAPK